MKRIVVLLCLLSVLWPGTAQTFIRSLPTSTNLTSATKVPVDDATYGTRAVTLQNLLASTATNATLLAAITNVVEDTATSLLGNKLDTTNGTAVNLTGSLTNVTAYGATTLLPGNVTGRTNVVQVAPYQTATYAAGDFGPNSGETSFEFVNVGNAQRLRQTGTLQRVKVSIASTAGVTGFFVKVWRKVASNNYSLVGTSENLSSQLSAGSVNTLDLSTTIAAQVGDYVGVRVTYSAASARLFNSETPVGNVSTNYSISNTTATDTFYAWESQTATANATVVLECYMTAPILVGIGDSIMSGSGTSTSLIQTNSTYVGGYDFPERIATGTSWSVQNMGVGSDRLVSMILPRFTNDVLNSYPRIALLEGGVNDLRDSVSTASILSAYNTMLSNCVAAGIQPVLIGILPFRGFSGVTDAMLTNRDTLNPQLSNAVVSIGGIYVHPDPYVGRFWPGGPENNRWQLDRTSDSGDGIHLSNIGQANIVRAIFEAMAPLNVRGGITAGSVNAGTITVAGPIQFSTGTPQILTSARPTNTAIAASLLLIEAQSAAQTATNADGGTLVLQAGRSTGSGTASVLIQTPTPGSSGTADAGRATRAEFSYAGANIDTANNSFGAFANPDSRFGIYYRDSLSATTDIAGIYSLPHIAYNASGVIAAINANMVINTAVSKAAGIYLGEPAISGGSLSAYFPVFIDLSSTPSNGSGIYIGTAMPGSFSGTYALTSNVTNAFNIAGPFMSSSYFQVTGENHSFGSAATSDARFGIRYRGTLADSSDNIGIYATPQISVNSSSLSAGVAGTVIATGHIGAAVGVAAPLPVESGGNITNWFGMWSRSDYGAVADYYAGHLIGYALPTLTTNYGLLVTDTNFSRFIGPVSTDASFSSAGNAHALGAGASLDARFGLYLRPSISSSVNAYGLYSIPSVSGNAATPAASVLSSVIVTQPTTTAIGNHVTVPIESGSGVLTNWIGVAIDTTPVADREVGLYIGRGTPFSTPADYAIYSTETNASYFAGPIDLGASDTTLARSAAGVVTIEGVTVAERPTTTALTYSGTNVTLTATSHVLHGNTLTLTNNCLLTITSSDGASGGITIVPHASTSYTVYLDSAIKLLGGGSSFVVTNSASETVNLEWKQTLRGGSSAILANKAVYP